MVQGLVTEKEIPVIQVHLLFCKNEYHSYIVNQNVNYFFNVYLFFFLQASSQELERKQRTVVVLK